MSTWPLGLPVCDAAQPEDDSALVLLHDLQEQKHRRHWRHTGATDGGSGTVRWSLRGRAPTVQLTHLDAEPNGDGKEDDDKDAGQYDQDPANAPQRPRPLGWMGGKMER